MGKSLQFTTTQSGLGSVNCFCARPMNDLFFPLMRSRVPTTDITIWADSSLFCSKKLFLVVCFIWRFGFFDRLAYLDGGLCNNLRYPNPLYFMNDLFFPDEVKSADNTHHNMHREITFWFKKVVCLIWAFGFLTVYHT